MAVGVVIECKGATLDQYDEALAKMGRAPRGRGAPGSLFHWVTATHDGIRVTDVWDTREEFEKFAGESSARSQQRLGSPPRRRSRSTTCITMTPRWGLPDPA